MSIALYRKYRPENFENLVGQDVVQTTLRNAIASNKLAQAYVFAGPRGTGKTSTARLIAKALNCSDLQGGFSPCDKCEFCTDISQGSLMDVIEIDAASHNGVDDVRELVDKINFSPTRSKHKIYIVDEAHMMSKGAFNALLKTLEEPPEYVYFILATTEIHKIPETILSRCQRFDFQRLGIDDIASRLKFIADQEGFEYEEAALEMVARFVNGGMRDAVVAMEKLAVAGKITVDLVQDNLGISDWRECQKMWEFLLSGDSAGAIGFVNELYGKGVDLRQFLKDLIELERENLLKAVNEGSGDVGRILKLVELALEAQQMFGKTDIPQLVWEVMVVKCCMQNMSSDAPKVIQPREEVKKVEKEIAPEVKEVERVEVESPEVAESAKREIKSEKKILSSVGIEEIRGNWISILEKVEVPSLRMSFKTLTVLGVEGDILNLGVDSSFQLEKVKAGLRALETAIEVAGGWKLKVELKMVEKSVDFRQEERESAGLNETPNTSMNQPADKIPVAGDVHLALDMFGGEIVD